MMNLNGTVYAILILVSLITFLYTIWSYYECPKTRSHRPYIFPIFVSAAWIVVSLQGLTGRHGAVDGYSLLGLSIATLVSLLIFIRYYRQCRGEHNGSSNNNPTNACTAKCHDRRVNLQGDERTVSHR